MKAIAQMMSEYLVELEYEDLPIEVIELSKMCVLDMVGVSMRGSILKHCRILAQYIKEIGGKEEATVIGYPFKTSCANAGLINGAIGHSLQMDDGEMSSIAHLGCEVIPAALAVGERENISGKDFLVSMVTGYEGSIRIGASVNPSHYKRGFSPNGTIGVFGAAISSGKALKLDVNAMTDAISSAAMQSAGLEQFARDGSMNKFLNTGHATQAGIQAALLAEKGFTGSHEILEGVKGFCRAYSDNYDIKKIYGDLGKVYKILDTYFKPYPTCRFTHPATDVILKIVNERETNPSEIDEIVIKTYPVVINTTDNPDPTTEVGATLSMQYAISTAIIYKKSTPDEFTEDKLSNVKIRELMKKIKLIDGGKELQKFAPEGSGAILKLKMKNGEVIEDKVQISKGEPKNQFSSEELIEKFKSLSLVVIKNNKADKIIETVDKLEKLKNIKGLAKLLTI